ncbi:hypothetical protein FH972_022683 [Carpinus fangiana]|uniref:Uncharacterized protein n=1 Tax=Carpinus fangiana TaxID=176857 RepID=A0A5N6KTB9_9ROSI|nr:hypothetical protein FH972_022683 [Carpinus fangiana]
MAETGPGLGEDIPGKLGMDQDVYGGVWTSHCVCRWRRLRASSGPRGWAGVIPPLPGGPSHAVCAWPTSTHIDPRAGATGKGGRGRVRASIGSRQAVGMGSSIMYAANDSPPIHANFPPLDRGLGHASSASVSVWIQTATQCSCRACLLVSCLSSPVTAGDPLPLLTTCYSSPPVNVWPLPFLDWHIPDMRAPCSRLTITSAGRCLVVLPLAMGEGGVALVDHVMVGHRMGKHLDLLHPM